MASLGGLRKQAELLLEDHLVGADGSRTLRTEKELARVAAPAGLAIILKQLEGAAILRAEEHHGSRYFEIGHDWLARRVYEQRHAREQAIALEREREENRRRLEHARKQRRFYATIAGISITIAAGASALGIFARAQQTRAETASVAAKAAESAAKSAEGQAKAKAIEASDARLMAGFRELRNRGQVAWGMKLLHDVQKPEDARGWMALANDALLHGALEVTLRASSQAFGMAAWSPDGTRVAAGSQDGKIWVWNASGEGRPSSRSVHEKPISSIAWSPDGSKLLTASEDGTAKIVSADGSQDPIVFAPQAGALKQAVFSPQGDRIAVFAGDSIARVWLVNGSGLVEIKGHDKKLTSLVFSPDGQAVITASEDKTARISKADGTNKNIVLRGHKAAVRFALPSPDGAFIITTSDDNTARIWAASGKGLPVELEGHRDAVMQATWSPDGKYVATASLDKTARIWAADGKLPAVELNSDSAPIEAISFRKDGRYLLTKSFGRTIAIWPASGGKPFVMEAHDGPVAFTAWSPDGTRALSAAGIPASGAAQDTSVKVWHFDSLEALPRTRKPFFHAAAILPGGARALAAFDDRSAQIVQLDGGGAPTRFSGHEQWITNVAASADAASVLTMSADKTARLWNANGKGDPVVFRGAEGIVRAGSISPDGKYVLTGSDDNMIRSWKIEGGTLENKWAGHTDIITSIVYSPDGRHFVSTSMDQTARRTSVDNTEAPVVLAGHCGGVLAVAYSADGSRIVTASEDTTARVWDGKTGAFLYALEHDGAVLGAVFSKNGQFIATSSLKNGLRIWNADGTGDPIEIPVNSPIVAMMFIDDDKRIVTLSEDETTRTFFLDVPLVMKQLESANRDCLPAEQRVIYMGETTELGKLRHETCERLAKRTPDAKEGR